MTKNSEIDYLLQLVSESERDLFQRLYPNGIKDKKHAILQLRTTILRNAERRDSLREENKKLINDNKDKDKQINQSCIRINELLKEIVELKYTATPIEGDDLLLLESLQHEGVDNWDGYDYAMGLYEKYKEENT